VKKDLIVEEYKRGHQDMKGTGFKLGVIEGRRGRGVASYFHNLQDPTPRHTMINVSDSIYTRALQGCLYQNVRQRD
jgi:hypothetical protein